MEKNKIDKNKKEKQEKSKIKSSIRYFFLFAVLATILTSSFMLAQDDFSDGICSVGDSADMLNDVFEALGSIIFYGAPGLGIIMGFSAVMSEAAERQSIDLSKAKGPIVKGFGVSIAMALLSVTGLAETMGVECFIPIA